MRKRYAHSDDYDFEQKMQNLLMYRKVIKADGNDQDATLVLDNGVVLNVEGNRGCGGCGNGWYFLEALNKCNNVITNVEAHVNVNNNGDDVYHLFVYAEDNRINLIQYAGADNGYYGTGYDVYVTVQNK